MLRKIKYWYYNRKIKKIQEVKKVLKTRRNGGIVNTNEKLLLTKKIIACDLAIADYRKKSNDLVVKKLKKGA